MEEKKNTKSKVCFMILALLIICVLAAMVFVFLDANNRFSKNVKISTKKEYSKIDKGSEIFEDLAIEVEGFRIETQPFPEYEDEFSNLPPELKDKDFILDGSDSRYLLEEDLIDLDELQLVIARNEIYARKNYIFSKKELNSYFETKHWYTGLYKGAEFSDAMLNEFEKANAIFISNYEKEKGYN